MSKRMQVYRGEFALCAFCGHGRLLHIACCYVKGCKCKKFIERREDA